MYEESYGFSEKPFNLTPDPKCLYKSESHGNAFDLLQYAIRRREGFVVITGDIGTGKTTLCRAILEQLDHRTFTALVGTRRRIDSAVTVLPLPDSPTSPSVSPLPMTKLTPSTAIPTRPLRSKTVVRLSTCRRMGDRAVRPEEPLKSRFA